MFKLLFLLAVFAAAVVGALFLNSGLAQARRAADLQEEVAAVQVQTAALSEEKAGLVQELEALEKSTSNLEKQRVFLSESLDQQKAQLVVRQEEVSRLRAEVTARAREEAAARARQEAEVRARQEAEAQRRAAQTAVAAPAPTAVPTATGSGAITLSFDDSAAPSRVYAILDILASENVKSVFCVTGDWASANPAVIARMQNEGHTLCNHTASHTWLTQLSDGAIRQEILGGLQSQLLRPPYGAYDGRVADIASSLGYQVYMWSIDTRDWQGLSADAIISTVMTNLRPGAVVLMHLQGVHTLEALPRVISGIRDRGYQLG